MSRCRICNEEYSFRYSILDDDLCEECETVVLETLAEMEEGEEDGDDHG